MPTRRSVYDYKHSSSSATLIRSELGTCALALLPLNGHVLRPGVYKTKARGRLRGISFEHRHALAAGMADLAQLAAEIAPFPVLSRRNHFYTIADLPPCVAHRLTTLARHGIMVSSFVASTAHRDLHGPTLVIRQLALSERQVLATARAQILRPARIFMARDTSMTGSSAGTWASICFRGSAL